MKQRIIKFRTWDKENKILAFVRNLLYDHKLSLTRIILEDYPKEPKLVKDFELMQYTGLKDKNGKEIFEGDIVKWMADDGTDEYPHEKEMFTEVNLEGACWFPICNQQSEDYEVIGNIYSNKDLLNS